MPGPRKGAEKPKNFKKTLSRFLIEAKPYKKVIILAVILSVVSVLFTVFGPMILGLMTTSATTSIANGEGIKWNEIATLAIVLLSLYVLSGIIGYIKEQLLMRTSARFSKALRGRILEKISKIGHGLTSLQFPCAISCSLIFSQVFIISHNSV